MKKPNFGDDYTVDQEIDLSEFVDVDLSDERGLKESIGQAIIDKIVARTEAGKKFGGGNLRSPYSKDYVKSVEFKAAGKKPTQINMTLTGDMLASMDVDARDGSTVRVFVTEDQSPKAYNHNVGDTVPKRPWFGVTKSEMQDILDDFADDIDAVKQALAEASDEEPGRADKINAIDALKGNIGGSDEGDDE